MIKRRKNFFPTLFLAILFWLSWGFVLIRVPPESNLSLAVFYLSLFFALFLTTALIFANSRRGLMSASFIVLLLLFRYYQVGNLLNLLLLLAIFVALELYLSQRRG